MLPIRGQTIEKRYDMSGKTLIILGLVAAAGYGLQRNQPPGVDQAGVFSRMSYGLGRVGSRMVGKAVTGMVTGTEQSLVDMHAGIKKAKGGDGIRAKDFAKKVTVMDSAATAELTEGRPIRAIKSAMEAKSMLNAVRQQINRTI